MRLILKADSWSNAESEFLQHLFEQHFELSHDLDSDGIIYAHWQDWEWAKSLNRPAIIDHLWDPWQNPEIQDTKNLKVIRSDGWFCIANECLWYKALGLDEYKCHIWNRKNFLMLMNYQRPHRDQIWRAIQPHLSNSLYSYHGVGQKIEGDLPRVALSGTWQRHLNRDWYDLTKYSLVVETDIQPGTHSEKILKPCAFGHPFIAWAPAGYLKWLRSWGFETFDNCIDESYDLEQDDDKRLAMIIEEVARLNGTMWDYFMDIETQRRLDVNRKRFYNVEWAHQQFEKYFDAIKQHSNNW